MAEIFSAIAAVCALAALVVSLFVLKRQKTGGAGTGPAPDSARLEQMLARQEYIVQENARATRDFLDFMAKQQGGNLRGIQEKLEELNAATERRLSEIQRTVAGEIRYMTEQNAKNLADIRTTVDEKLSNTLETRLSRSYSIINERLEAVYKGIGEMQRLAGSVADIKKVFSNVKTRGMWGEVQLSALLEQMLSPAQYRANVHLDPAENSVVEFAVLLPSKEGETVWLPIDSKCPTDEYVRLVEAGDALDKDAADRAAKNLERALKTQADLIAKKYIRPPLTADFAIMFLPLEGLYAECVKMPGLADHLAQRRILACGPTNLGALLTTLQIGYKTAAIEKRSGELWELLSAFKHEFRNFVQILEKAQKKLQEAQDTIENAAKKTRTIDRKLKNVSEIGETRANQLLGGDADGAGEDGGDLL